MPLPHQKTRVLLTMRAHGWLGWANVQGLYFMATSQALADMHCEHATPVFVYFLGLP